MAVSRTSHAHTQRIARPREGEMELYGEYRREGREKRVRDGADVKVESKLGYACVHVLCFFGDRKEPDLVHVALFFIES